MNSNNNLCKKCNKFYGRQETQGYCSVCFKGEKLQDIIQKNEENISTSTTPLPPVQQNKFNCFKCEQKVGYLGFKCKCNYIFCRTHRHYVDHDCTFDFKSNDREKFIKNIDIEELSVKITKI